MDKDGKIHLYSPYMSADVTKEKLDELIAALKQGTSWLEMHQFTANVLELSWSLSTWVSPGMVLLLQHA